MEIPDWAKKRTCMCAPLPIPKTKPSSNEIRDRCKSLELSDDNLKEYQRRLLLDIEKGLAKKTHDNAVIKCFITYVQDLPTGQEEGKYLALDLGGTNFRVLLIELTKDHFEMKARVYAIPQEVMSGSGDNLFNHIANCLHRFMKELDLLNDTYPLGFTFSFPLVQKSLNRAAIERWTKGFQCADAIGKDPVELLEQAIAKKGFAKNIKIRAIINDTTGTLIACSWKSPYCRIGLIVGTGSNACYVEKQANAELFDEQDRGSGNVLINTEWGAFGDDGSLDFIRTPYDIEIDQNTINPGKQLHEKMISGMYLGEIVRQVVVKCTKDGLMFGGKGSDALFKKDAFLTKYVSEIESDPQGTFSKCKDCLNELGLQHANEQDCLNVRYVCEMASRRAAHLCSAGIAALMNRIGEKRITVGIDGSVYRFHPHFHNLMMEKIATLVKPGIVFDLMLSEDGSGRGAALAAAVADKYNK